MQIKTTVRDTTSYPLEWLQLKRDITTNVDEDVETLLTPEIIGSNIKWFSHF